MLQSILLIQRHHKCARISFDLLMSGAVRCKRLVQRNIQETGGSGGLLGACGDCKACDSAETRGQASVG